MKDDKAAGFDGFDEEGEDGASGGMTLTVHDDELYDVLDEFDSAMAMFHCEAHLIDEFSNDLLTLCGQESFSTPIPNLEHDRPNAKFHALCAAIGADTPQALADASGESLAACESLLSDPLGCDAGTRNRVVSGLGEKSGDRLWATPCGDGYSVWERLYLWMRDYFMTPFQLASKALAVNAKCSLVAAVDTLTDTEVSALSTRDASAILKSAAAHPERYPMSSPAKF